jgi:hypothetical protein
MDQTQLCQSSEPRWTPSSSVPPALRQSSPDHQVTPAPRRNRRGMILVIALIGMLLLVGVGLLVVGLCSPPGNGH